jgi:hypothetical protein
MVEALLVDGEDHHLRSTEDAGIIECADFDEHDVGQAGCPGHQVRAALTAELARHGIGKIAAAEGLGRTLDVGKARFGHADDDIGVSTRDVLAFSTMALALELNFARRLVTNRTAIAPAVDLHKHPFLLRDTSLSVLAAQRQNEPPARDACMV